MRAGLALNAAATCLMIAATARPATAGQTLEYPADYRVPPEAVSQSNAFAVGQEMTEPLKDGWQHDGFLSIIGRDGKIPAERSASLVVDRARDPVLRQTIEEARRRFGALPEAERAAALTRFAHQLFTPRGMNDDQLSDWDDSFGNQHRGRRILLGEYIARGRGVCLEEATLLKILADELGLPATLVFGFDDNVGHVWTTIRIGGQELLYDPAQEIIGTTGGAVEGHQSIRRIYGQDFDRLPEAIAAYQDVVDEDYPAAERRLQTLAEIDARVLGDAHPACAVILARLASVYRADGKEAEAEPYLKRAAEVCARARGACHQEVADCLNDLAGLERSLGKSAEAARLYRRAIAIYRRTLGRHDASVADPLYNLGDLYLEQKRYGPAERLLKRALAIYSSQKGDGDEDAVDTMNKLSELYRCRGDIERARVFEARAKAASPGGNRG